MDTTVTHFIQRVGPRSGDPRARPGLVGPLWLRDGRRLAGRGWVAWRAAAAPLPAWSGLLLAMAVLGLVLALHQVVHGAVQQGESRRQATAALAEATWRCKTLRSVDGARNCLARLKAPSDAVQGPLTPDQMPAGPVQPAVLPALASPSDGATTRPSPQSRSRSTRPATPRGPPESSE